MTRSTTQHHAKVDAAAVVAAKKAEHAAKQKRFKEEYALADMKAKTTILDKPIPVKSSKHNGLVVPIVARSKDEKPKAEKPRAAEPPIFDEKDLTRVPGIVGRMVDWIEAASLYPNRPLALGTSLVTVGTLMGQRVAGPTQGSTHLYVQQRWKARRGLSSLSCCAMAVWLPLNSAKTMTNSSAPLSQ
jgi:hypothetical protein